MNPIPEPIEGDAAQQAPSSLPSRRTLLGLCLLTLGLAACEGDAYWDSETGQFRIPFGGQGGRSGNR